MTINLQKTQYISLLSGFKRKFIYTVSNALPGYTLGAGTYVAIETILTFRNPGAVLGDISSLQIKYDGLDSFWRTLDGFVSAEYTNYEVSALTYFSSTQHTVYVYIVNETGGTINVPAFTIRYKLNTYDSPF